MSERIDLHDLDTDSAAFVVVGFDGETVTLGIDIEANGDLDLVLAADDARRLAASIAAAADRCGHA